MVLQLTMQEPKRVAELTCEFKKQTPPDAAALWDKCLVRAYDQPILRALPMTGRSQTGRECPAGRVKQSLLTWMMSCCTMT